MKKKKRALGPPKDGWLVTFSDLMTLLLTFFVLLLSMSSLDVTKIMEITIKSKNRGGMGTIQAKIATRIEMISEILRDTTQVMEPEELLRDLFFPENYIPEELRQDFVNYVRIFKNEQGIVIILADNILFKLGKAELSVQSKLLLGSLVEVLQSLTSFYNISGYTDISGTAERNYILSGERALNVLEFFVMRGVAEDRFSVSAYGADRPVSKSIATETPQMERRIEILIKK